jgi:XTP/dITP diphosphohydrolase
VRLRITEPVTLASRNRGKLAELEALGGGALRLRLAPADLPEIPEDADTYLGNALAKARGVAEAVVGPALADDSGLEVDALGGAPGVRSARFGGPPRSDAERSALLLEALAGAERRSARFRCVLVLFDGREWCSAEGVLEGEITREPRGSGGFGYDPIFSVPELGDRTLAEVDAAEKNRISHRAAAMRRLLAQLAMG